MSPWDGDPELRGLSTQPSKQGLGQEKRTWTHPVKDLHETNLTSNSEVKNWKNESLMIEIRMGVTCGTVFGIDRKESMMEFSGGRGRVLYLDGGYVFFQNSSGCTYKICAFHCK